jgi:hypothetical protein
MFYTGIHNWQNDKAVKQVLAFSHAEAAVAYISHIITEIANVGIENYNENGFGAAYKLRAVLDRNGDWIPLIREANKWQQRGLLWEGDPCKTPEEAIKECKKAIEEHKF